MKYARPNTVANIRNWSVAEVMSVVAPLFGVGLQCFSLDSVGVLSIKHSGQPRRGLAASVQHGQLDLGRAGRLPKSAVVPVLDDCLCSTRNAVDSGRELNVCDAVVECTHDVLLLRDGPPRTAACHT